MTKLVSCFSESAGGNYVRTDDRSFDRAERQSARDFAVHEYLGAGAERCQLGAARMRRMGLPLPKIRRRRDRPTKLGKARLLRWDPNHKAIHRERYKSCVYTQKLTFTVSMTRFLSWICVFAWKIQFFFAANVCRIFTSRLGCGIWARGNMAFVHVHVRRMTRSAWNISPAFHPQKNSIHLLVHSTQQKKASPSSIFSYAALLFKTLSASMR